MGMGAGGLCLGGNPGKELILDVRPWCCGDTFGGVMRTLTAWKTVAAQQHFAIQGAVDAMSDMAALHNVMDMPRRPARLPAEMCEESDGDEPAPALCDGEVGDDKDDAEDVFGVSSPPESGGSENECWEMVDYLQESLPVIAAKSEAASRAWSLVGHLVTPNQERAVGACWEKGALVENDNFIEEFELGDHSVSEVQELVAFGIIEQRLSEFGECMYALRTEAIRVENRPVVADSQLVITLPPRNVDAKALCKLECCHALIYHHWRPESDVTKLLAGYSKGGPQVYSQHMLARSKLYFVCLLEAEKIWKKPGSVEVILHGMPHHYYASLLGLRDLSAISALENLCHRTDAVFKDIFKRAASRSLKDRERAGCSLEDGAADAGVGSAPDDGLALEDGVEEEHLALQDAADENAGIVEAELVLPPAPMLGPGAQDVAVPGHAAVRVWFDNATGASGELRALVTCPHHDDCRCYRQVNKFGSMNECIAWLAAWVCHGKTIPGKNHLAHLWMCPPASLVESTLASLGP
jgi:hypothetical protein